jgi:DNA-binding transcriptional MerR regulator/effector-binding domain-containing protein
VATTLTIGDFSKATFLSVKTLRHYHRVGLLEPAEVDETTGYRRYSAEQIPTAQVIRRFRDLDMPLDGIRAVIQAPDQPTRGQLIAAHLSRLEQELAETQRAVAALRDLIEHPSPPAAIDHRQVPATAAAAVTTTVDVGDLLAWYHGAIGEIDATLSAQGIVPTASPGGIYANELFYEERGEATVFVPAAREVRPVGRVRPVLVPEAELAVITHCGSHADLDRSYGALATYVSEHALAVEGPVREYYPVGRRETSDEHAWRTDIGWPIFDTRH